MNLNPLSFFQILHNHWLRDIPLFLIYRTVYLVNDVCLVIHTTRINIETFLNQDAFIGSEMASDIMSCFMKKYLPIV